MVEKFPITTDGYERMQEELKHLKNVARPSIIKEIAEARAHGDLSENAEYHAAREKQSFNEGRINELEDQVARANVIDINKLSGENVTFGATVTIIDDDEKEFTYQIVSPYEADLEQGRISITSPIARGLIGKAIEDYVEISTPKGEVGYEILKVEFI